ncbi:MAG: hypothetical protein JXA00_00670 [Candidatus Thermoplasmatota archaeon]|nr:hypothetical protein [Candidatus Thermoplasmatota archaeon]
MNSWRDTRRTLILACIFLLLTVPLVTQGAGAEKTWRIKYRDHCLFPCCWMWYVRDSELHTNQTDEKLRGFFTGCQTPRDFYDRIQQHVRDSFREIIYTDLDMNMRSLPVIVDTLLSNDTVFLFCHHQAFIFAAGVKAMFSTYDEQTNRYVLNAGCSDFSLEIWRSADLHEPILPYRSHVQIIIDEWNGTSVFELNNVTTDRIEADNWEDEFRPFNQFDDVPFPRCFPRFFSALKNSLLETKG